ncbi:hypothetical protein Tco_0668316 [Tanacetum coccineum]
MVGVGPSVDSVSNLDCSNVLHLQNSDFNVTNVISIKLSGTENYRVWAAAMRLAINTEKNLVFKIDGFGSHQLWDCSENGGLYLLDYDSPNPSMCSNIGKLEFTLPILDPNISYAVTLALGQFHALPMSFSFRKLPLEFFRYLKNYPKQWKQINKDGSSLITRKVRNNLLIVQSSAEALDRSKALLLVNKHFQIDVHLVREKVASGVIVTEKIHTSQQIAMRCPKALSSNNIMKLITQNCFTPIAILFNPFIQFLHRTVFDNMSSLSAFETLVPSILVLELWLINGRVPICASFSLLNFLWIKSYCSLFLKDLPGTDMKCCNNRLNKGRRLEYSKQVHAELLLPKKPIDGGAQELNCVSELELGSVGALIFKLEPPSCTPRDKFALDLAKETYAELLLREYYSISHDDYRDFRLAPLGESLCLICDSWGTHTNLDLWVMTVYGAEETWVKFTSFQFATHGWIDESLVPLFCSNDGKLLFQCQMGFIIYDLKHSPVSRINYSIFDEACIVA